MEPQPRFPELSPSRVSISCNRTPEEWELWNRLIRQREDAIRKAEFHAEVAAKREAGLTERQQRAAVKLATGGLPRKTGPKPTVAAGVVPTPAPVPPPVEVAPPARAPAPASARKPAKKTGKLRTPEQKAAQRIRALLQWADSTQRASLLIGMHSRKSS